MSVHSTSERVIIVGGGFAGLASAAALAQAGVAVTLFEASQFGVQASTHNQGWLHSGGVFARNHVELARMCYASLQQTLAFCPECVEPGHDGMYYIISCPDTLTGPWLAAWQAAGIPIEPIDRHQFAQAYVGIDLDHVQQVFRLPDRAIKTDLLLLMLVGAARNAGAELRASTPVTSLIVENHVVKGVVTGAGEQVFGRLVINAAGTIHNGEFTKLPGAQAGEQNEFTRVILKTHLVSMTPDLGRMPFCVVDRRGFNHIPHPQTSVFGSERWYPVSSGDDLSVDPEETAALWDEVKRFFPHFDRDSAAVKEWAGTTAQAMHADQVVPGDAPLPTVIDHQRHSPRVKNLLSIFPGRATLWPQLAEQVRTHVLDHLGVRSMEVAAPPWAVP